MLSTNRKFQKNHLRTLKRRLKSKTRNENPNTPDAQSMVISHQQEVDKDRKVNMTISRNNEMVRSLTQDVENIDIRIQALCNKIHLFCKLSNS